MSVTLVDHMPSRILLTQLLACAGELLDTLPPGVDELVAISNVVRFIRSPEYAHFTRIIFDTAPTGHTLRLLSAPDFLDASLGGRSLPDVLQHTLQLWHRCCV